MTKINSFTDPTKVRKSGDTMTGVLTQNGANLAGTAYQSQSFQNLIKNGIPTSWSAGASAAPDGWALQGPGVSVAREAAIIKLGTYSAKLTRSGSDSTALVFVINDNTYQNRTFTFGAWVYATVANRARLKIEDVTVGGATPSSYHTGNSTWQFLTVTKTMGSATTGIRVCFYVQNADTSAYVNGAILVEGSVVPAFSERPLYDDGITLQIDSVNNFVGIRATPKTAQIFVTNVGTDKNIFISDAISQPGAVCINAGNDANSVNTPLEIRSSITNFTSGNIIAPNIGIGKSPGYLLELNTDSAGKPGAGGLWTIVSDERIKKEIVQADLDRCYEIVKSVPLKYFAWNDGIYTDEQVRDRHNLGWIAQDVQKVFPKATSMKPFTKNTPPIPDGKEVYEEQDYTVETIEKEVVSIEIRNGIPVQIKKIVSEEKKTMLFNTVNVVDETGKIVMNGKTPLTQQVPKMVTKTRPKFRQEVIEDCLDLNAGQMYAAMYGALQKAMQKIETLEKEITLLKDKMTEYKEKILIRNGDIEPWSASTENVPDKWDDDK